MSKALTDPISVAEAMADANAEVLDDLPAIERGRYRRMARAAIAALPPAVPAASLADEYKQGFDDGCAYMKEDYEAGRRLDALAPTTPDPVAEAAKVLEQELNLAALIESLDGNEAHRIMPHIWPILCKYVELTKDGEAG